MEDSVRNFCRTLENYNTAQHSLTKEVLETFGTLIEEILLASHIAVSSSDAKNVKPLFQELTDLITHIQPEENEQRQMITYLKRLESANESCLFRLYSTIIMCRDNMEVAEKEILGKELKEEEMTDLSEFLTLTSNIFQGIMRNPDDIYMKKWGKKVKKYWEPFSYQDEVIYVKEISQKNLGKMIVRYIGHEGVDEKTSLRRLLQACIDFLPERPMGIWKNASITIYNVDKNMYKIASQKEKHQFTCRMKNEKPFISEETSVSEHKKPKPNHKTSTTNNSSKRIENFEQTVMNFCRSLEACSAGQKLVADEVLKSCVTFVEELLLAFSLKVGSSDTINVKELLYKDLTDLIRHLQPEQNEQHEMILYLTRLQEAKKDSLSSLLRNVTMCSDNIQVAEKEVLQRKMKEQEKIDLMDFMTTTTNIVQGIFAINPNDSNLNRLVERMKEHRQTYSFKDEVMDVEEINKINLGKMIVRYVGHEGAEDKPRLRPLLQACIDFLQTEAEEVWKNASISIYDVEDNMYTITSGIKKHQFICWMKDGEPFITGTKSDLEHSKLKQSCKPSTDHSKKNPDSRCLIS